jgi:NAD(P)-dependent dehydrogenase (short-subunit alcohol dehydrogenase family)
MKRLNGKVALITGGGRNLGRELALALAKEGADIIINYFSSENDALQTQTETEKLGVKAMLVKTDISRISEIQNMANTAIHAFGKIDILINNAGIFMRTPLNELTEKKWDEVLDTNLKSVLFTAKAFFSPSSPVGAGFQPARKGMILNIADVGGFRPWPGYLAYCISKAGVIMATKCLASALAPDVQVNCIAPGMISFPEEFDNHKKDKILDRIPMKRLGSYQDIVNAALFLLCDASFVTGQAIIVDGGRVLN